MEYYLNGFTLGYYSFPRRDIITFLRWDILLLSFVNIKIELQISLSKLRRSNAKESILKSIQSIKKSERVYCIIEDVTTKFIGEIRLSLLKFEINIFVK